MFCTNCGKEISDEAKFCRFCGSPVAFVKPPVVEAEKPAEIKEEPVEAVEEVIEEEEAPALETEAVEKLAEAKEETAEAVTIEEKIEKTAEEPVICPPAVTYAVSPVQYEQEKPKKKVSPVVWVAVGAGVLLIAAVIIIISLLSKLSKTEINEPPVEEPVFDEYDDDDEVEIPFEEPAYSDYPELSHDFDDFINSTSFDSETVLGKDEILYMGEAFYDDIGECYVSFMLSSDRKTLKNFTIYLNQISLELSQNGATYDLGGVSIRQNYNNTIDYTDDYSDIMLGDNTLYAFYLDTECYSYAYGEFDYSFTYYPPSFGGSASSPIETYLGVSGIDFVPVKIG